MWWEEDNTRGWEGYKFSKRLRSLRRRLEWNKEVFGDVMAEKKACEVKIKDLDRLEGRAGLDEMRRKEREELCLQVADLIHKEEILWRQKRKGSVGAGW